MPLPTLADLSDLEQRLGDEVDDAAQAEALLRYASSLVRAYKRQTWVNADGELEGVPDGVAEVTVEMVYRALSNPQGVTQDTTGPFSVSYGSQAAQRVYLTAGDKQILGGAQRAFTIDTAPAADLYDPLDEFA
jgi:hypothetical protein